MRGNMRFGGECWQLFGPIVGGDADLEGRKTGIGDTPLSAGRRASSGSGQSSRSCGRDPVDAWN
jgi:hypothetical protein